MDKLTRYNQKLIAIITTTLLAGLVLLIIGGIGTLLYSFFSSNEDSNTGIQVKGNSETTDTTAFRTQQASFNNPILIDSARQYFIIPVGQVNLEKREELQTAADASGVDLNYGYDSRYKSKSYDYYENSGLYNNFVFYEYKTGSQTQIFTKKIVITDWFDLAHSNEGLVLFKGTNTDINKDNILDNKDYQSLFAFYLKDKKLVEYKIPNKSVLGVEPLQQTDLIAIRLGNDKNQDLKFNSDNEPEDLIALNIETRILQELVPPGMKNNIQKIIDN